jgi:hypothetical protein
MVRITTEIDGKLYEFKRHYRDCPCESCDLQEICGEMVDNQWEGLGVCDALPGVWKEVCDADVQ